MKQLKSKIKYLSLLSPNLSIKSVYKLNFKNIPTQYHLKIYKGNLKVFKHGIIHNFVVECSKFLL